MINLQSLWSRNISPVPVPGLLAQQEFIGQGRQDVEKVIGLAIVEDDTVEPELVPQGGMMFTGSQGVEIWVMPGPSQELRTATAALPCG